MLLACSDTPAPERDAGSDTTTSDTSAADMIAADTSERDTSSTDVLIPDVPVVQPDPELWYSVDTMLVHIAMDASDGSVMELHTSELSTALPVGQNGLTVLEDGSLFGSRLSADTNLTTLYLIESPPRDGSTANVSVLGLMPDDLMLEGLYSDCEGRVYAMDTGADATNSEGNRLLRFTGDVRAGELAYVVVSELGTADVADIDDMGPGIRDNTITDNPGLAIDSGAIHDFDYESGSGTQVGTGGSYGIHALGGALFDDGRARLFVFSIDADLFELDPESFEASEALIRGPMPAEGIAGWSGLAGPLTECESGFELI